MGIPFEKLNAKTQERIRRENPDVFRPLVAEVAQPASSPPLDGCSAQRQGRKSKLAVRVTLVTLRRRVCDDDNDASALKPVRDAIARSIGLDDGDPRIKFEYGAARTDGQTGVMVKIEQI